MCNNKIAIKFSDFIKTPIEEVTDALYGKGVKFMMTHDVELKMPVMMFDGATFKISPRSIEGNGVIAKLEFITPQEIEARAVNLNALRIKPQGRIFFKKISKYLFHVNVKVFFITYFLWEINV